ncbi:PREDICTED: F-box/kelch-repeat protein At3g23880-like [Ipomoea nil]|uniref:F-box/kelch-repeat protein At3g23880-like n=1 Tax=Ipomoea nil TaxID=35883 RepID=UPI000900FB2E|nr:PREDICTED: F-box/kelch-repeat protein At3g23880-like [Ipomoea nil]
MEVVHHHIPIEIIRQILLNLEVKAVIQCECVCKEWRSTIQDPDFKLSYRGWKRVMVVPHGSRTSLAVTSITNTTTPLIETLFRQVIDTTTTTTLPPLDLWWSGVWCSCNGLVLFSVGKHILLRNPSTRCCTKVIELPHFKSTYLCEDVLSGLCYVSSTGDYKAVLLIRPHNTVMVASLKNKEWREVTFPYHAYLARDGVNFRNTLHWRVIPSRMVSSWRCKTIVYFDAESDEFKELPTPELEQRSNIIVGLGIIDNCLSMARLWKATNTIEVLVMKKYGVKRSWYLTITQPNLLASVPDYYPTYLLTITQPISIQSPGSSARWHTPHTPLLKAAYLSPNLSPDYYPCHPTYLLTITQPISWKQYLTITQPDLSYDSNLLASVPDYYPTYLLTITQPISIISWKQRTVARSSTEGCILVTQPIS